MMSKLFVSALLAGFCSATTSVEINKVHTSLNTLATFAESYLQSRCSSLSGNCNGECSVPACGSTFDTSKNFECREDFGTNFCGACETRSLTTSAIRMPLGTNFQSADAQAFTCATKNLDTKFKAELDAGNLMGWQYVSHGGSGITRLYPGAPQGRTAATCENYDARLRSWYTSASAGPKDVVLLLDASTSMQECNDPLATGNCETRWAAVKKAVRSIYGTLTPNDFVGTVSFSTDADTKILDSKTGLIRADTSTESFTAYQNKLDTIFLRPKTNMAPGFTKAFDLLTSSDSDSSSGCTKIILFLTDGDSTDVANNLTASLNVITAAIGAGQAALVAKGQKKAHIFTYSMGTGTDTTIPKAVACANEGVWASIASGVDPLVAMKGYYQFLSTSISATSVRWSAPYQDAFGLGTIVTASRPIYDYTTAVPVQVGVVSTDIIASTLGGTSATVVNQLIADGNSCPSLTNLTVCQLQNLRKTVSNSECPGEVTASSCLAGNDIVVLPECTAVASLNSLMCTSIDTSTLLQTSGTAKTNQEALCISGATGSDEESSSNTGVIIGVVVGVLLGLALIGGIVAYVVMSPAKPPANKTQSAKPESTAQNTQQQQPTYPVYPQQPAQQQQYPQHQPPPSYQEQAGGPAV